MKDKYIFIDTIY